MVRFRKVLTFAQHVPRYHSCLKRANLTSSGAIAALRRVEDALPHFAAIDLEDFEAEPAGQSAKAPAPHPQKFRNPLNRASKVAMLMDSFEEKGGVRLFGEDALDSLEHYGPEVLAAPVSVLRRIAAAMEDGSLALAPLKCALVAFTGIGETLDSEDRDRFWRSFQVPLFEQYIGLDGRVVARECEIHDGLHLVQEHAVIEQHDGEEILLTSLTDFRRPTLRLKTGYAGAIETSLCECGQAEPRLMELAPLARAHRAAA